MRHLPRFALGAIQPGVDIRAAVWGLIAALTARGESPVLFRSSCDLAPHDASLLLIGRPCRHLDSWAMSRSDAICALARATSNHDTAIVEGHFGAATSALPAASSLDRLCEWLDLPRIAVVDVRNAAQQGVQPRPQRLDGLLLDRVNDAYDAAYWQTTLETLWGAPVIGCLDEAVPLRALCTSLPGGVNPSRELCEALGERLLASLQIERLRQVARRATPLPYEAEHWLTSAGCCRFRIAVALDDCFGGYYPETLDLLEAAGAELCDFSPLRSEAIPDGAEIVYFGCGRPEREAHRLAANHCLQQSLRTFAAAGGRVYAEGSGLAYLCREMELPGGERVAMTGLLPATARWLDEFATDPVQVTFGASSWLASAGISIRGYRHRGWQIEPRGAMLTFAREPDQRLDILGRGNVIASRVLINLAANRHLLRRFFEPYTTIASALRRGRN
jgi:cobyrinic acid a,c-diamide synthase